MSTPEDTSDDLTPAERALDGHLQLLRSSPPETDNALVTRVLRSVRWQRVLRRPVVAAASLAAAAVDGIRLLFGGPHSAMIVSASTLLDQAARQLGGFLPRLVGALVLLVVGVLIVRLLCRLLRKALQAVGLDELAARWGVTRVLEQAGLGDSLAVVVARAIRIALTIVVLFAALSLLGLQFLSDSLNKGIQELPKLLIAAALLLTGIVLAGYARDRADRLGEQMDSPVALGRLAQITVLAIFAIIAAAQIAVSTLVLLLLVGVLLSGAVATFALAFGLGGREVARALSAGRYLRHDYTPGQDISVQDVRGRVTAIEATSTVLDAGDGRQIRVPNHLLLESITTIYPDADQDPGEDGEQ